MSKLVVSTHVRVPVRSHGVSVELGYDEVNDPSSVPKGTVILEDTQENRQLLTDMSRELRDLSESIELRLQLKSRQED